MSLRAHQGFTLLELLIAVSLSAILMTVLTVGLNQITRDWEKSNVRLEQKLDESLLLLQIENALLGSYPYFFKENNLARAQLFFSGSEHELSWVSTVSPDRSAGLVLWHLQQAEQGGLKLIVQPAYPGDLQQQIEQTRTQQGKSSIYFADYKIAFSYLHEGNKKIKQWSKTWMAKEKNKLPLGVRIVLQHRDDKEADNMHSHYEIFAFIRAKTKGYTPSFGGGSSQRTGLLR